MSKLIFAVLIGVSFGLFSCTSVYRETLGGDTQQIFTRIYITDFNTAWQATLDALKSSRLDVSNREGGFIQTRWSENTAEKNFIDSFGTAESYLKAQYRFRVTLGKGNYNGSPGVKIIIQKEQLIQRDVLEGWRPVETDAIDEKTLLYRVGRLIWIRMKLARIEEDKTQRQIEKNPSL